MPRGSQQPDRQVGVAATPPLKWAGGKRWLVPRLAEMVATIDGGPAAATTQTRHDPLRGRRLVEPFAGGLAVALGLRPATALLGDLNPHAINFYRHLQRGLVITMDMRNERDAFYAHRSRFNELVKAGEHEGTHAAALFYYLNRTCFNGLCRFNSRGEFNVPFGRYAASLAYTRDFSAYRDVLADWEFVHGDFAELSVRPGDLVYADPPYDVPFTRYAQLDFRWQDQLRLAAWLAAHDGPVIASNQATERVLDLYRQHGFEVTVLEAPRRISCTGDRSDAAEMLATRG